MIDKEEITAQRDDGPRRNYRPFHTRKRMGEGKGGVVASRSMIIDLSLQKFTCTIPT